MWTEIYRIEIYHTVLLKTFYLSCHAHPTSPHRAKHENGSPARLHETPARSDFAMGALVAELSLETLPPALLATPTPGVLSCRLV